MANKKIWLGILVLVLIFGMGVVGCDNGSTGDNGNGNGNGGQTPTSSLIKSSTNLNVELKFNTKDIDIETFDAKNDFSVFIDGTEVTVDSMILFGGSSLYIGIAENDTCVLNTEYTVKVVYDANAARIIWFDYGKQVKLESFTVEKKVKCVSEG